MTHKGQLGGQRIPCIVKVARWVVDSCGASDWTCISTEKAPWLTESSAIGWEFESDFEILHRTISFAQDHFLCGQEHSLHAREHFLLAWEHSHHAWDHLLPLLHQRLKKNQKNQKKILTPEIESECKSECESEYESKHEYESKYNPESESKSESESELDLNLNLKLRLNLNLNKNLMRISWI